MWSYSLQTRTVSCISRSCTISVEAVLVCASESSSRVALFFFLDDGGNNVMERFCRLQTCLFGNPKITEVVYPMDERINCGPFVKSTEAFRRHVMILEGCHVGLASKYGPIWTLLRYHTQAIQSVVRTVSSSAFSSVDFFCPVPESAAPLSFTHPTKHLLLTKCEET